MMNYGYDSTDDLDVVYHSCYLCCFACRCVQRLNAFLAFFSSSTFSSFLWWQCDWSETRPVQTRREGLGVSGPQLEIFPLNRSNSQPPSHSPWPRTFQNISGARRGFRKGLRWGPVIGRAQQPSEPTNGTTAEGRVWLPRTFPVSLTACHGNRKAAIREERNTVMWPPEGTHRSLPLFPPRMVLT